MKLTMIGQLEACHLLSYAIAAERAVKLLPSGLEPVTHAGSAFLNIVVCRVDRMRPKLVPRILGATYWHVAYRLQVRARLASGDTVEGLYFLRSDVDRRLFGFMGNVFTDFRFFTSRVVVDARSDALALDVDRTTGAPADARLRVDGIAHGELTPDSCFATLAERDACLKYMPFGLSTTRGGRTLRVAEVRRDESAWSEAHVRVLGADWAFVRHLDIGELRLERATRVAPIDYRWEIGRTETLAPAPGRRSAGRGG